MLHRNVEDRSRGRAQNGAESFLWLAGGGAAIRSRSASLADDSCRRRGACPRETALCAWQFLLEQKLVTHHISPCLQLVSRRQKVPEAMVEEVGDGQGAAQAGKGEHQLNPHRMSPEFVHGRLHLSMVAVRLLGRRAPVQHDGAPGTPCTVFVSGVSRRGTR